MKRKLFLIPIVIALSVLIGANTMIAAASVKVQVASLKLSTASVTMTRGATFRISAKTNPANATNKHITWSSSNSAVASVSGSGLITAKRTGSCSITARSCNNKTAKCKVAVKAPKLTIVSINDVIVTTTAGTAPNLPATVTAKMSDGSTRKVSVTWSYISPDNYVSKGVFTVNGTVAGSGICAAAIVTVKAPPETIASINPVSVTTAVGVAPRLPSTVIVIMSNGTTRSVSVRWNAISSNKYAGAGSFTVYGTVSGTEIKAVATVTVKASQLVTISGIDIANEDYSGNILSDPADATFDKDSLRFIVINFKLTHYDGKSDNVFVKIYDPSGKLETYGDGSSPSGYTAEATNNRMDIGNSTKSVFSTGVYKVEFWYGGNLVTTKTFTVKASNPVTISGIDIANEDYSGNTLSDPTDATFEKDSLRYICVSFSLSHLDGKSDHVFVKIYDPSGNLLTYSNGSSPSGYTAEATNNRISFGNSTKSIFSTGIYNVEFWYGGNLVTTKTFTVKVYQPVVISNINIFNADYNRNVLSDPADATFDENSLRYISISFNLTHYDGKNDNVFVKIYDPSGNLETYGNGSSPSGYTAEATNNRMDIGNSTKSVFGTGIYKVEFWYGGKLVTTKNFTVE